MAEESLQSCSQCGKNGHNSRTCTINTDGNAVKLFGVYLTKPNQESPVINNITDDDSSSTNNNARVRGTRGTAWTEAEHMRFLTGLDEIGRGNWKRISEEYVLTRTTTQVASHAQKYFSRQELPVNANRSRRNSIFDITLESLSSTAPTMNHSIVLYSTPGSNSYHRFF